MKIDRAVAKQMIENAGLIYGEERLGPKLFFRGVYVKFRLQDTHSTAGYIGADMNGMLDSELVTAIIEAAKVDSFIIEHHFNRG